MKVRDFLERYVVRGSCVCGRCLDAETDPSKNQPEGHVADVMFFKVALLPRDEKVDLRTLIEQEFPTLLDGLEHSYIEIGGLIGDQGEALMLVGAGSLLGLWELMTPRSMLGRLGLSEKELMELAGSGMVSIQAEGAGPLKQPGGR